LEKFKQTFDVLLLNDADLALLDGIVSKAINQRETANGIGAHVSRWLPQSQRSHNVLLQLQALLLPTFDSPTLSTSIGGSFILLILPRPSDPFQRLEEFIYSACLSQRHSSMLCHGQCSGWWLTEWLEMGMVHACLSNIEWSSSDQQVKRLRALHNLPSLTTLLCTLSGPALSRLSHPPHSWRLKRIFVMW